MMFAQLDNRFFLGDSASVCAVVFLSTHIRAAQSHTYKHTHTWTSTMAPSPEPSNGDDGDDDAFATLS